jgi:hypothetical protein
MSDETAAGPLRRRARHGQRPGAGRWHHGGGYPPELSPRTIPAPAPRSPPPTPRRSAGQLRSTSAERPPPDSRAFRRSGPPCRALGDRRASAPRGTFERESGAGLGRSLAWRSDRASADDRHDRGVAKGLVCLVGELTIAFVAKRSSAAAPADRSYVAIGVVRSNSAQIVKAIVGARRPSARGSEVGVTPAILVADAELGRRDRYSLPSATDRRCRMNA